ncbi:MAG: RES family NAD+ phosphorylase [Caulobacterales bacterium]|uniref:RES family NAD+ phosphorylase n=1 Tax=Glycocaulis sp. TaxID=1969725 RepID=UPI003F9EFC1B
MIRHGLLGTLLGGSFPGDYFANAAAYFAFEHEIKSRRRYRISLASERFLDSLVSYAEGKVNLLDTETTYYRAVVMSPKVLQQQSSWHFRQPRRFPVQPLPEERMKPDPALVSHGRANPPNIARLYLSTDVQTAASEVRAYKGAGVSIAEVRLVRPTKVAVFRDLLPDTTDGPAGVDLGVWAAIGRAFASPVAGDFRERSVEYAPTQVIAEAFEAAGFDGLVHQSAVAGGQNVVLFDPSIGQFGERYVQKVARVQVHLHPPSPLPTEFPETLLTSLQSNLEVGTSSEALSPSSKNSPG